MKTFNYTDLIQAWIERYLGNTYTSLPAVVLKYEPEKQMVDVQPLISKKYPDGYQAFDNVYSVPVIFPSAGGGIITFPIQQGDIVLLNCSMLSIDSWKFGEGDAVEPEEDRVHDLSDAFAIPCTYTANNNLSPNPEDVEVKFNNLSFRLEKESKDIVMENPSYSLKLRDDGTVLHSSGARITPEGDFITANGISVDNHIHSQGNDSGGSAEVDTDPPQ